MSFIKSFSFVVGYALLLIAVHVTVFSGEAAARVNVVPIMETSDNEVAMFNAGGLKTRCVLPKLKAALLTEYGNSVIAKELEVLLSAPGTIQVEAVYCQFDPCQASYYEEKSEMFDVYVRVHNMSLPEEYYAATIIGTGDKQRLNATKRGNKISMVQQTILPMENCIASLMINYTLKKINSEFGGSNTEEEQPPPPATIVTTYYVNSYYFDSWKEHKFFIFFMVILMICLAAKKIRNYLLFATTAFYRKVMAIRKYQTGVEI